jgi:hypothetical protein
MYQTQSTPDFEFLNKFKIDPTEIMIQFLYVIDESLDYKQQFNKFIEWLEEKTKLKINDHQRHKAAVACWNYIKSKPETPQRSIAMKEIFNLTFL